MCALQQVITDDLGALLDVFPPHIQQSLNEQADLNELLEVVMDLGRPPEARFPRREAILHPKDVSEQDLDYIVSRIGAFGDDNRAGIERTLHRISAIRNRQGRIVGLTCRVGRAVFGTIKIVEDLIGSGKSILLLGRPGVGKTTMLREAARVLAGDFKKRVIIVDTSNEIAGDGDIPHPAIGHSRRMQVKTPDMQHAVMIEAVENHMPEVIIIDEMGTELEAQAARTIAERGVQLIATAHGNTLENLILNPTLADLIGGIQSVTLSDEEARRRGTQKSVLERMSPPTFDIVVEIQDRYRVAIHPDVAEAVDTLLRSQPTEIEVRWLDENGEVRTEMLEPAAREQETAAEAYAPSVTRGKPYRLYLFGVNQPRFQQAINEMHANIEIVDRLENADLFVTSRTHYRHKPQKVRDAEAANLPVFVVKGSAPGQIRQFLATLHAPAESEKLDKVKVALQEAEQAIEDVETGSAGTVELSPQSAYIRRLQHLIAQRHNLASESAGKEPERRVRIFKG